MSFIHHYQLFRLQYIHKMFSLSPIFVLKDDKPLSYTRWWSLHASNVTAMLHFCLSIPRSGLQPQKEQLNRLLCFPMAFHSKSEMEDNFHFWQSSAHESLMLEKAFSVGMVTRKNSFSYSSSELHPSTKQKQANTKRERRQLFFSWVI